VAAWARWANTSSTKATATIRAICQAMMIIRESVLAAASLSHSFWHSRFVSRIVLINTVLFRYSFRVCGDSSKVYLKNNAVLSFLPEVFYTPNIFWPRKSPYVRRVTRSYNSRGFGRERNLY
jgi:hypothetical protein